MLKRGSKNELQLDYVELAMLIGGLFEQCNTRNEVDWLRDILQFNTEEIAKVRRKDLI